MTETHGQYLVVVRAAEPIYRDDIPKGEFEVWLHHDLLAPTVARNYPGANGMKSVRRLCLLDEHGARHHVPDTRGQRWAPRR